MTESDALANFFSNSGPWETDLTGPALSLPEGYREVELKGELCVEYLQMGSTNAKEGNSPNKNHVVFLLPFKEAFTVEDDGETVRIFSARLSMDLTEEDDDMYAIDMERLEKPYINMVMCEDYFPGTLYIKLLKYDGQSQAAIKISVFADLDFTTLGEFVDFLAVRNLHKMSFLGYDMAWKGCRDFIMQTFIQLHLANKVAGTDEKGETLKMNITKVYNRGKASRPKLIDRGKFLDYIPVFPGDIGDAYEPESVLA